MDERIDGYVTGAMSEIVEQCFSKGGSDSKVLTQTTVRSINTVATRVKGSKDPFNYLKRSAEKLSKCGQKNLELFVRENLK